MGKAKTSCKLVLLKNGRIHKEEVKTAWLEIDEVKGEVAVCYIATSTEQPDAKPKEQRLEGKIIFQSPEFRRLIETLCNSHEPALTHAHRRQTICHAEALYRCQSAARRRRT